MDAGAVWLWEIGLAFDGSTRSRHYNSWLNSILTDCTSVHLWGAGGAVTRILESHLSTNKWESGPDERPLSKPVKPPHKALLAPPPIGYPLHHAVEYLKTSHTPFQRVSEVVIIYMVRTHPTLLIKVLVAGAPMPRPAQHFLSEGRDTDGDVAAPYVHMHAECNMESFR